MIRAVVDVNVFVSALISRESVAARLVRHTAERQFELVLSPRLLDELVAVARRPRLRQYFTVDEADRFIRDVWALAVRVDDTGQVPAATRDPDDDYLVALVRAAQEDVLVTGDRDLLELEDLPVLSPRAFVDRLETDIDAGPGDRPQRLALLIVRSGAWTSGQQGRRRSPAGRGPRAVGTGLDGREGPRRVMHGLVVLAVEPEDELAAGRPGGCQTVAALAEVDGDGIDLDRGVPLEGDIAEIGSLARVQERHPTRIGPRPPASARLGSAPDPVVTPAARHGRRHRLRQRQRQPELLRETAHKMGAHLRGDLPAPSATRIRSTTLLALTIEVPLGPRLVSVDKTQSRGREGTFQARRAAPTV